MKKLIIVTLCLIANFSFGSTNRLDAVAKTLDGLTNSWGKLTYDPNSTAIGLMCPKCVLVYRLPVGKVVKVGKSGMKCNKKHCNHTMWYVDEWLLLNFYHTHSRNMMVFASNGFYKAYASGDMNEAEKWMDRLKEVRDDLERLAVEKKNYLDRKKRR